MIYKSPAISTWHKTQCRAMSTLGFIPSFQPRTPCWAISTMNGTFVRDNPPRCHSRLDRTPLMSRTLPKRRVVFGASRPADALSLRDQGPRVILSSADRLSLDIPELRQSYDRLGYHGPPPLPPYWEAEESRTPIPTSRITPPTSKNVFIASDTVLSEIWTHGH